MRNSRTRSWELDVRFSNLGKYGVAHLDFVGCDYVSQVFQVFDEVMSGGVRVQSEAVECLQRLKGDGAARLLPCCWPKARAHELSCMGRRIAAIAVEDGNTGHSVLVYDDEVSAY